MSEQTRKKENEKYRARTKRTGRRVREESGERRGRRIEARELEVGGRWWNDQSTVYSVQRTETSERRVRTKHVCMYKCECMKVSM